MYLLLKERPSIIVEANNAKIKPPFIIQVVVMNVIFFAAQFLALMLTGIIYYITGIQNEELPLGELCFLFGTGFTTLLCILYCLLIEKRSLGSMGFVKKKWFKDYLIGLLWGFGLFTLCTGIIWIGGGFIFKGFILNNGLLLFILCFFGFLIQGMSEEVLLRGFFMISVANKKSILFAILANSLLFGLLHFANDGFSLLPLINLVLFGFFTSCYTLKSNSLWGVCALHSMWNFTQGNILGIKVSGQSPLVSLFSFVVNGDANIWNGGAFGVEGSIVTTVVLSAAIIYLILKKQNTNKEML